MATNDLSRRASATSSSEMSLVDPAAAAKLLAKKDKSLGPLKMKKSIAKKTKPKESDSKAATRSTSPETPSISGTGTESRASAPVSQPAGDSAEQVRCKHCKRSMAKSVAASHIKTCQEKKKERAQKKKEEKESKEAAQREKEGKDIDKDKEVSTEDLNAVIAGGEEAANSAKKIIKSAKKSAAKATAPGDGSSKKTKKRKADAEGDKEPKKKKLKKDEPAKAKVPKPKGPVDVEKQCGVLLPNGGSLPYDILLAQYQKKNQAKQQKAAMDANAPLAEEFETTGPVDSDEEKDIIMAALARSRPQPLAQHVPISSKRKAQYIRTKGLLAEALSGNRSGGGLFGRPPDSATTVTDAGNVVASPIGMGGQADGGGGAGPGIGGSGEAARRPSLIQQAVGGAQNRAVVAAGSASAQRKTSLASTAAS